MPDRSLPSRPLATLLRLALLQRRQTQSQPPTSQPTSQQGLSLIECLVAIIIIALTVVALTPPIMLATATRIQTRRADQANQIAQGEIDRIRTLVERGSYLVQPASNPTRDDLPKPPTGIENNIQNIGAANSATVGSGPLQSPASCSTYPQNTSTAIDQLVRVDVDGDCVPEYVMQVFRTTGYIPSGETRPFGFVMGVRVYSYFPDQPLPTLSTVRSSLVATAGAREVVQESGSTQKRPLAVLYSTIARNDSNKSLCQLRKLSNPTDPCTD